MKGDTIYDFFQECLLYKNIWKDNPDQKSCSFFALKKYTNENDQCRNTSMINEQTENKIPSCEAYILNQNSKYNNKKRRVENGDWEISECNINSVYQSRRSWEGKMSKQSPEGKSFPEYYTATCFYLIWLFLGKINAFKINIFPILFFTGQSITWAC